MANPYYIQPVDLSGTMSGLFNQMARADERRAAEEKQLAEQERQAAIANQASQIYQSGTNEELASFLIQNPQMQSSVAGADKILNERTRQSKLEAARNIALGANPQSELEMSAQVISGEGGDPSDTLAMTQQPYEVQKQAAERVWASLDPQGYKAWSSTQQQPMTEYQTATIESKKIDQDLRREENAIKRDQNRLKRETDELKKQQLEQDIQQRQQKSEQLKRDKFKSYEDSLITIDDTINTIDRLLAPDSGLESAAGIGSNFPTVPGSKAANFEAQLETLQSQAFLSQVEKLRGLGALSENEGKKLSSAIGSLSLNMSDKALTRELERIKSTLDRSKSNLEKNKPQGYKKQQSQSLSDEELLNKYGAY